MIPERLSELCKHSLGAVPTAAERLPQAGGDRRYFRLLMPEGCTPASVIGVEADSTPDARAFVKLSDIFDDNGVNVPVIFDSSPDFRYYLTEDLGNISMFSLLGTHGAPSMVKACIDALVKMQTVSPRLWTDAVAYPPFSRRQVFWDLNYFKYEYLRNSSVMFDEDALENDFESLADDLVSLPPSCLGFMIRDCQSRNVMIHEGAPFFIDFQGGRLGPCLYDAVSLLWQAKAGFSDGFRHEMLAYYIDEYVAATGADGKFLKRIAPLFVLFRTLQVLGAYGFRGLVQKRAHFIESIPGALSNLRTLVENGVLDSFIELKRVCAELVEDVRFSSAVSDGRLHVKVFSFSYKKGYPADYSGNGGGFMFDCRGMHNPGRYDEYKHLTGLDKPVIDFLVEKGEIDGFVDKAVDMVSPVVERYMSRGFSSLQVGFGCTGGRHRSVYSAQRVAERLAALFPAAVIELCHREQDIHCTYNQAPLQQV